MILGTPTPTGMTTIPTAGATASTWVITGGGRAIMFVPTIMVMTTGASTMAGAGVTTIRSTIITSILGTIITTGTMVILTTGTIRAVTGPATSITTTTIRTTPSTMAIASLSDFP